MRHVLTFLFLSTLAACYDAGSGAGTGEPPASTGTTATESVQPVSTDPVVASSASDEVALLTAVRAASHEGYDRVVVLAPIPRGIGPMASVDRHVAGLADARVAVVSPDAASRAAIGRNVLDPVARAPSARAGRAQAAAVAERVAEAWTG